MNNNLFKRYLKRVVGKKGVVYYFKYELLTSLLKDLPGALGICLRSAFYRYIFEKIRKSVFIEQGVTIRCPNNIIIDDNVFIEQSCYLIASSQKDISICINKGVNIGIGSIIYTYAKEGYIEIGENSKISHQVQILSHGMIKIGSNVLMGGFSYIASSSHIFNNRNLTINEQGYEAKGIVIEDDVWIGSHVNILDGVKIGQGSIIGSGAVVLNDIPEYSIAVGLPARVIKKRGE